MQNKIYSILSFIHQLRLSSLLQLENSVNFETFSGGRLKRSSQEGGKITNHIKCKMIKLERDVLK